MNTNRISQTPILIVLSLVLCSCAVSKQGTQYQLAIDQNQLFSTELQTFSLGESKGVLRKSPDNAYQIKLYDRMKVIDLGKLPSASVASATRFGNQDLIVVSTPSVTCLYAYRVYQVNGYEVGMWNINDTPSDCSTPLEFGTDAQTWHALQQSNGKDRRHWSWSDGKMFSGIYPAPSDNRPGSNAAAPIKNATTTSSSKSLSAHFESGDTPIGKPTIKGDVNSRKSKDQPISRAKSADEISSTAAVKKPPAKIAIGDFVPPSKNTQSEVAPVKINLRDSQN